MTSVLAPSYRIAGDQVIHELIADEVVIIDLTSGSYYSLDGVGAAIWAAVDAGVDEAAIVEHVQRHYTGDGDAIADAVRALLAELAAAGLIVAGNAEGAAGELSPAPAAPRPFAPPVLHTYTDMQELISLDPIHEVDDFGWPHRRAE